MYLTYDEYITMGGELDEATFNNFEFEAESIINWYTFNRLKNDSTFPTEVKRLMFYLIGLANKKAHSLAGNNDGSGQAAVISSQSNDGVSVSYNVLGAKDMLESVKSESETAVRQYLWGVMNEAGHMLLYRGVYPNE